MCPLHGGPGGSAGQGSKEDGNTHKQQSVGHHARWLETKPGGRKQQINKMLEENHQLQGDTEWDKTGSNQPSRCGSHFGRDQKEGAPWTPKSKAGEAARGGWHTWPSRNHAGHARWLWEHRPCHLVIGSLLSPAEPGVGCGRLTQYLPSRDLSSSGETCLRLIQTDRQTDQRKRTESPEINPHDGQMLFNTSAKTIQRGDNVCVTHGTRKTECPQAKERCWTLALHHIQDFIQTGSKA